MYGFVSCMIKVLLFMGQRRLLPFEFTLLNCKFSPIHLKHDEFTSSS